MPTVCQTPGSHRCLNSPCPPESHYLIMDTNSKQEKLKTDLQPKCLSLKPGAYRPAPSWPRPLSPPAHQFGSPFSLVWVMTPSPPGLLPPASFSSSAQGLLKGLLKHKSAPAASLPESPRDLTMTSKCPHAGSEAFWPLRLPSSTTSSHGFLST